MSREPDIDVLIVSYHRADLRLTSVTETSARNVCSMVALLGKWEVVMDVNRCPKCSKRMIAVAMKDGRTGLQCLKCDQVDPMETDAAKWAESPLAKPQAA